MNDTPVIMALITNKYKGKTSIIDVSPVVTDDFPYVKKWIQ